MSSSTKYLAFGLLLVALSGCVPEPTPAEVEAKMQEAIRWYTGVTKNDSLAAAWWRKAAEKGDAIAQYRLGIMYQEGRGVPQSDSVAVVWWRDAVGRGERHARTTLQGQEEQ